MTHTNFISYLWNQTTYIILLKRKNLTFSTIGQNLVSEDVLWFLEYKQVFLASLLSFNYTYLIIWFTETK